MNEAEKALIHTEIQKKKNFLNLSKSMVFHYTQQYIKTGLENMREGALSNLDSYLKTYSEIKQLERSLL